MAQGRRTALLVVGLTLAALALCAFAIRMYLSLSFLGAYLEGITISVAPFVSYINIALTILIMCVLVISGIMLLASGGPVKKSGRSATWCVAGGAGDLLLAVSLLLGSVISILSLNYMVLLELFGNDYDMVEVLLLVLQVVSYLFCAASGALYLRAGISQKKVGKANILFVISGCALLVLALLALFHEFFGSLLSINQVYILQIVIALCAFAGRSMRGLAPISFPVLSDGFHAAGGAPVYAQPYSQQAPYGQQPYAQAQQYGQQGYTQPQSSTEQAYYGHPQQGAGVQSTPLPTEGDPSAAYTEPPTTLLQSDTSTEPPTTLLQPLVQQDTMPEQQPTQQGSAPEQQSGN